MKEEMKKIVKLKNLLLIGLLFSSNIVLAGEYYKNGYITQLDANTGAGACWVHLSNTPSGNPTILGKWNCASDEGKASLKLANTAKVLGYKVKLILNTENAYPADNRLLRIELK